MNIISKSGLTGKPLNGEQSTDTTELTQYLDAKWQLIPLHKWDYKDSPKGKPRERGKSPKHNNWVKRPYKNADQIKHMEKGGNVGVRLRAEELVIDVDPRNFAEGDDPIARLCKDYGIDRSEHPTVETGSGGLHIYMKKPADVSVRDSLKEYEGVEFKTLGRQVVAAGSIHPTTGKTYEWGFLGPDLKDIKSAPDKLLDLIRRPEGSRPTGGGEHDQEELAIMLDTLDPEKYSNQDEWFTLMQACHHATAGDGRAEFIEWSTRDPAFSDHSVIIGRRWDSLRADNDGSRVTYRTLHKIVMDAGGEASIPRMSAEDDFADLTPEDIPAGGLDTKPPLKASAKPLKNKQPMTIASAMLKGKPFIRFKSEWFRYDQKFNHYKSVSEERFKSYCWKWVNGKPYNERKGKKTEIEHLVSAKTLIANVIDAATANRQGPDNVPCWINGRHDDIEPEDIMVCSNGLLYLPTRELLPPDKRFFSVNGSPVEYDANAPEPKRWLKFLKELFPDEPDCIDTLQEATGYFLSQDTSQQKIIQFIGQPRSGKGVYTRILLDLIGKGNVTSPTAKSLSGEFGRQSLIGKQLATISDSRLGMGVNTTGLKVALLTISGEDDVSIPRKYLDAWQGKLNTRFLIVSNEMLQLRDTSDALGGRMIVIKTNQHFLGREDQGLTTKLKAELPGILNWALDGLESLKSRGHFVQPQSCMAEVMHMHMLTSPVKFFFDTEVVKGSEFKVEKERLWYAFEEWCLERGLNYSGGREHFMIDLNSAGGRFQQSRLTVRRKRVSFLLGLDLKADFQTKRGYESALEDFKDVVD